MRDLHIPCAGVGDGDHLGDARGNRRGRRAEHRDGPYDTVDLRPLVNVLGLGLRDPVPAVTDGGALQGLLQHLRQPVSVHNRLPSTHQRWRADDGAAPVNTVPGLRRGDIDAKVPIQDDGDVDVADNPGGSVVWHAVRLPDWAARAGLRRLQVRGEHPGGRRAGGPGPGRGRADGSPSCGRRQTLRQQGRIERPSEPCARAGLRHGAGKYDGRRYNGRRRQRRRRRGRRRRRTPGTTRARRRVPTAAIQHRVLTPGSVIGCCDQQ